MFLSRERQSSQECPTLSAPNSSQLCFYLYLFLQGHSIQGTGSIRTTCNYPTSNHPEAKCRRAKVNSVGPTQRTGELASNSYPYGQKSPFRIRDKALASHSSSSHPVWLGSQYAWRSIGLARKSSPGWILIPQCSCCIPARAPSGS